MIFLDNAATTFKPRRVLQAYHDSFFCFDFVERVREKVAAYLNVSANTIKFTRGTTNSINLLADKLVNSNDNVLLSIAEHHSNILPWQARGAKLIYLEDEFCKSPKVFTINHVSNVLGVENDLKMLISRFEEGSQKESTSFQHAKIDNNQIGQGKRRPFVLVDGAQAFPHLRVDLKKIECDAYAFSAHKAYGPQGLGILYDKHNLINETYDNYPALAAFEETLLFLEETQEESEKREREIVEYMTEELKRIVDLVALPTLPIFTFSCKVHPHDVASYLSKHEVCIRAGHHCAQPLLNSLGLEAACRASFGRFNTLEDGKKFITLLKECLDFFS